MTLENDPDIVLCIELLFACVCAERPCNNRGMVSSPSSLDRLPRRVNDTAVIVRRQATKILSAFATLLQLSFTKGNGGRSSL